MRISRSSIGGLLTLATMLAACGTDNGGTTNPGGDPAIAISVNPTSLSIQQGASGSVTASITRSGGFSGTVNIATEGAPTGVTATVSNVSTSGGTTTGTITVAAAASTTPGTYNLTIRASGSGVSDKTVAFTLTVTAAPAIALSLNPTSLSLDQGASGTSAVTINRTNFTGNVTLTLEGAPQGVTGSFNPAPATGTSSTLTVQVGAAVAPGTYSLTVRGTGSGVTDATAPLSLTVTSPASFEITTLTPDPITVVQGASGNVTVTLTRNNFAGAVTLSLEGNLDGITSSFTPAAPTGTSSTLALTVAGTAATGNRTLTVRGTGTGVAAKTKTFVLNVSPGVDGNFTLSTTPTGPVTVQQNAAAVNVTVNINRTGFSGQVTLSTLNVPTGVTAVLTPTATTGNSVNLALSATTGAALGNPTITIKGTAAGLGDRTTTLGLTITAPSGGSGNVSLDFANCAAAERPVWFAYQNGSGAWTRVTPTGNLYSFTIDAGKGGIAWVVDDANPGSVVTVQYFSQAELTGFPAAQFCGTSGGKTLTATTAGLSFTQFVQASIGGGSGAGSALAPSISIKPVQNGTFDLVAYASSITPSAADRLIIRRDINTAAIADGGSVGPVLDFGAAEAVAPASATITVNGMAGGESISTVSMLYGTGASCTTHLLYGGQGPGGAASTFTAYGVPAGKQRGTDYHSLFVSAGTATSFRMVSQSFQAMADRSVSLPAALSAGSPTILAGPYKRLRFQTTLPAALATGAFASYLDEAASISASMTATGGWLGGTAVDLSMPDFSGVSGWNNAWMPGTGTTVNWNLTGSGANGGNACNGLSFFSSSLIGTI